MEFISWTDNYSVNIKQIDQQHQKLIELINKLYDAMKSRKAKEVLGGIIDELAQYAVTHFETEEKLFEQYVYPDADEHTQEHKDFIAKVSDFKVGFDEGRLMLSTDMLVFLQKWLVEHISGSDKKYTAFLNGKGVS